MMLFGILSKMMSIENETKNQDNQTTKDACTRKLIKVNPSQSATGHGKIGMTIANIGRIKVKKVTAAVKSKPRSKKSKPRPDFGLTTMNASTNRTTAVG